MGTVVGYGVALQASCLEGFDSLGLHQIYAVGLGRGHVLRILDSRARFDSGGCTKLMESVLHGCL